jgi:hypothetical protein
MNSKLLKDSWKWFMRISTITNVIYSTVELYSQTKTTHFWQKDDAKTASLVIGGIYTGIFVLNMFVDFAVAINKGVNTTWKEKTDLEKVCVVIESFAAFVGLALYVIGAKEVQAQVDGINVLIVVGWTLGCAGHIFSMLGSFIASKRRGLVLRRRQGDDIEMM